MATIVDTKTSVREIESFLYEEAALLDAWEMELWLKLFLPDGEYLIPSLEEPEANYYDSLYLVLDDVKRLTSRIHQYAGRAMWAENPHSRTRRMISNVRILSEKGGQIGITANFAVYRIKGATVDTYIGRYEHKLVRTPQGFRFRQRKSILDLEALNPQGKVSIIL